MPKGLARSRATGGRRNGIYGGDPFCGEQAVYAGFALPLSESKPARRQLGEHCRRQCGGVATHGSIQPDRACGLGALRGTPQRSAQADGAEAPEVWRKLGFRPGGKLPPKYVEAQ